MACLSAPWRKNRLSLVDTSHPRLIVQSVAMIVEMHRSNETKKFQSFLADPLVWKLNSERVMRRKLKMHSPFDVFVRYITARWYFIINYFERARLSTD